MNTPSNNQLNLVADIGGTNTRLALARGNSLVPNSAARFSNSDHTGLGDILRRYISEQGDCVGDGSCIIGTCVAVAGPVQGGVGYMTNLNWTIDRQMLMQVTGAETVAILNDLQAQGHGLVHLPPAMLLPILSAPAPALTPPPSPNPRPNPAPDPKNNKARLVVGIGTGFNAAAVYSTRLETLVPPSEVGHTDLPVQNPSDYELLVSIRTAGGFCAIDDVLSGRGLELIYRYQAGLAGCSDSAKAARIMERAAVGDDPVIKATLTQFIRLMGGVTANLALTYLPFGGVFLAGGVARAMAPYLQEYGFSEAFHDKGRFADFMSDFPVSVILDDDAALTGCASFLLQDQ